MTTYNFPNEELVWLCNKKMDDYLHFQGILSFFKRSIPNGISLTNKHMFILDGHGSHVTLKAIKQAQKFGLDLITLFSHTSHAFQLLGVACFKLFKIVFKRERNTTMVSRNYIELDKITLVRWVHKALNQALMRQNIIYQGSKVHGFSHLTLGPWLKPWMIKSTLMFYTHW
jgi:hypothetical protein